MMAGETVVTVDQSSHQQRSGAAGQQSANGGNSGGGGGALGWVQCNIFYFTTVPGILKIVQVVLGIICMALASPAILNGTHWFLFVAVTSFIATILWSFVYLLGIREMLNLPINWILTELINAGLVTILYLTAFIVQLAAWSGYTGGAKGSNVTAGVFGIFNTIAYGAGTYFLYLEQRSRTTI